MSTLDFETAVKQEEAYLRRVHPTPEDIPGCMTLLDEFLSCHGAPTPSLSSLPPRTHARRAPAVISSQVKALYRHGQMAECGQKLEDVKFCLRSKADHPEARRAAWIRHRAEWWARRRMTRSSEDVWTMRTCVVFFSLCFACFVDGGCADHCALCREPIQNFPPAYPDPSVAATSGTVG